MIDLIKKAAFTGIGVASLTTEKVEELARELIDKSKMPEQEGEKFVEEMLKRAEESRESLKKQVEVLAMAALAKVQQVKAEEVAAIQAELAALRKEVEALKEPIEPSEDGEKLE
jgi:polyhydroxyalkanoate synthesis regulator phasin